MSISLSATGKVQVDVGTPPSEFQKWESAQVYFHGFTDLSTAKGDRVELPKFTCLGSPWRLEVFPSGYAGTLLSSNGMVGLFLHKTSGVSVGVDYYLTVMNSTGRQVAYAEASEDIDPAMSIP